jgi:hypothetical protein
MANTPHLEVGGWISNPKPCRSCTNCSIGATAAAHESHGPQSLLLPGREDEKGPPGREHVTQTPLGRVVHFSRGSYTHFRSSRTLPETIFSEKPLVVIKLIAEYGQRLHTSAGCDPMVLSVNLRLTNLSTRTAYANLDDELMCTFKCI